MRNVSVPKRSVMIAGHKTSLSLENGFWECLKEIAAVRGTPVGKLVAEIDQSRTQANLSSAIRLFVLNHVRMQALTNNGLN
jgi:predicted DNA-binding ribbon-helix-helix protein